MRLTPIAIACLLSSPIHTVHAQLPPLSVMTATVYHADLNLSEYWVSEKLDGIRAIWDGSSLRTRGGRELKAPAWFTRPLPSYAVEGELWAGRGNFHLVQQTVLDQTPVENAWQKMRFVLFDLPTDSESYAHRYLRLSKWVQPLKGSHIELIEQHKIDSEIALMAKLDAIVEQGGEGVMLKRIDSLYQSGRSSDLVKLKKYQDGEATVIGYKPGKGKLLGMMGALLVQLPSGQQFYLGGGFSDEQRKTPPPIGQQITFRFNGYTQNGIPKFARFIRQRKD